ncbi:hypothetical protein GCM10011390_06270 [Aureimonas endophytica]|uniref:Uncharacterized protein n=1 Tax=Aureimonas endophytica TaxID=2027858 RepID=A0A917E1K5_9HYPH|nr:hypothetical protein [Aureimonas endophytica]GGD90236.1 hypothetical protein GCM10011390_06270 [Aureimonas endophytica]
MTERFRDLTPRQILMLDRLDDGWAHKDSIGQPMRTLSDAMLATAFGLIDLDLATVSFGWHGIGGVRLTQDGRRMRDKG